MLSPQDCNFMFCLPLTKKSFDSDKENSLKHFVREHLPLNKPKNFKEGNLWETYLQEVVEPYQKLKSQFEQYGFVFTENVTFEIFTKEIQLHHVNILFSHCKSGAEESVEFYNKLVFCNEFVNAIPINYNKVIDLSICKPKQIAEALKELRRNAIIKSSNKSIGFIFWLYFYSVVFEIIINQESDFYSNVLEKAISKILEK